MRRIPPEVITLSSDSEDEEPEPMDAQPAPVRPRVQSLDLATRRRNFEIRRRNAKPPPIPRERERIDLNSAKVTVAFELPQHHRDTAEIRAEREEEQRRRDKRKEAQRLKKQAAAEAAMNDDDDIIILDSSPSSTRTAPSAVKASSSSSSYKSSSLFETDEQAAKRQKAWHEEQEKIRNDERKRQEAAYIKYLHRKDAVQESPTSFPPSPVSPTYSPQPMDKRRSARTPEPTRDCLPQFTNYGYSRDYFYTSRSPTYSPEREQQRRPSPMHRPTDTSSSHTRRSSSRNGNYSPNHNYIPQSPTYSPEPMEAVFENQLRFDPPPTNRMHRQVRNYGRTAPTINPQVSRTTESSTTGWRSPKRSESRMSGSSSQRRPHAPEYRDQEMRDSERYTPVREQVPMDPVSVSRPESFYDRGYGYDNRDNRRDFGYGIPSPSSRRDRSPQRRNREEQYRCERHEAQRFRPYDRYGSESSSRRSQDRVSPSSSSYRRRNSGDSTRSSYRDLRRSSPEHSNRVVTVENLVPSPSRPQSRYCPTPRRSEQHISGDRYNRNDLPARSAARVSYPIRIKEEPLDDDVQFLMATNNHRPRDVVVEQESQKHLPPDGFHFNFGSLDNYSRHPIQGEMATHVIPALADLSTQTRCHLEMLPGSRGCSWRWIKLVGEPEDVSKARDTINKWILSFQEAEGLDQQFRHHDRDVIANIYVDVPVAARSALFGPKRVTAMRRLDYIGSLIVSDFRKVSLDESPPIRLKGEISQVRDAYKVVKEVIQKALEDEANNDTVTLRIPNAAVGAIMGRKGVNIKRIQDVSSTHITLLAESDPSSNDRILQLIGPPDQITKAIAEIQKYVDDSGPCPSDEGVFEVWVPALEVGRLIGRERRRLDWIREKSKAKCQIVADEHGNSKAVCSGGLVEADFARYLVLIVVNLIPRHEPFARHDGDNLSKVDESERKHPPEYYNSHPLIGQYGCD